ncbi:MFS transporter [Curtobacterium sp. ISL-83]|uniref:MFS transporter n=1 Tax=Curtobacterium sp. ISL-83 TaxID=2819145 RepID=UPI001BEBF520|nr:MFS transporter [Curtobacterium sp. ISL-83]MBT2502255.1 MFS transporter [Curtobacterium sp. ISL-83]
MPGTRPTTRLLPVLVYAALCTAIVSSLGMLLVPTISRELHVSVSTAQWMLTINLLVGAVATPVMGRLSDGPHKKRVLVGALTIILIGSVVAASAPNFTVFLIGRAMQGLTYGIVPVTIALARRYLPTEQATGGISTLSVTVATGIGIGYPLTGIIAGVFDYRVAFWFAAVFVLSAIVIVARVVPAGPDTRVASHAFDFPGAALLGLGLAALLTGVSEGPNWGWGSAAAIGAFVGAAVVLAVWVVVELRSAHPLINLRVLRNGEVLLANATAIGLGTVMYMGLSIGSLIAQAPAETGYGIALPVFWAGFVMFPLSVGSFTANQVIRVIAKRIRMTTLLPVGAAVVTVSSVLLLFAHHALWEILLGMLLFGLGIGSTYAAMPGLIARRVIAEELGSAVSFNQVLRTVGGSFGSAISGAILAANIAPDRHPSATGIDLALVISASACAVVLIALVVNHVVTHAGSATERRTPGAHRAASDPA